MLSMNNMAYTNYTLLYVLLPNKDISTIPLQ
jgi:hypothetical protein